MQNVFLTVTVMLVCKSNEQMSNIVITLRPQIFTIMQLFHLSFSNVFHITKTKQLNSVFHAVQTMQFCFYNLSKILFTTSQSLRSIKQILIFLIILSFQFNLKDIHIQLFINRLTNLSESFYTLNCFITLDKTFIVVMSLYTVTLVSRIVFINLYMFSLSLDFKLKMNSSYLYDCLDTAVMTV